MSGGAGIKVTITSTQMSLDFSGMQPVAFHQGSINGDGMFLGQESAGFSPRATGPSTGAFTLTPISSNVTFESKFNGGSYGAPIKADAFPPGGVSGSWTCSASSATLTVPSPHGPTTFALQKS
jgi:hypothetical protein